MAHSGFGCRVQQTVGNGITRNRLQAKWGDKGFCRFGHGYADVGPAIAQTTHQFRGFIGSNTAADAENDFFTGQACGDIGPGRMLDPLTIVDMAVAHFSPVNDLKHLNIMITAGPTRELTGFELMCGSHQRQHNYP